MNFQKTTIIVAGVILVISLLTVAYLIRISKTSVKFPPTIGSCPDYWRENEDGDCVNVKGIGSNAPDVMSFEGAEFLGANGIQAKCDWSRKYGLTWDGVTNNPLCS
jgi:hypothetical protein